MRNQVFRRITGLFGTLVLMLIFSEIAVAASGITYHGRILRADKTPVEGQFVGFRVHVMDGDTGSCELYQETHTKDMRNSDGVFSLSIGSGAVAGTYNVTGLSFFDEIFENNKTYNFNSPAGCIGSPYVAGSRDGRKLFVQFRETAASPWEDFPIMAVNHVPFAYQSLISKKVGVHDSGSLVRVENSGAPSAAAALTPANFTELLALLNGTTTQYVKSVAGTAGEITVSNSAGTATLSLSNVATVTAGTYGSATQVPVFTVDAKGRITGVTNTTITGGGGGITDLTGDVTASGTGSVAATIAANAVTTAKILDANVTTDKLAADSVTTAKILNANVTDAKLASDSVTTVKILDANVTLNKLASDSVNSAKIVDGSITGSDISSTAALSVASVAATGNVGAGTMSTRSLGFFELPGNGVNNVSFQAPDNLAGNSNYIWPAAAPGSNMILQSDSSGNLSWVPDATGGSPGDASYAAKGVVQFDTDAATSGITVASGVAKIATGGVSNGMLANTAVGTTKVADDAITFAKLQNIATNKLLGRGTAATGDVEEITLGTGLSLSGTTLNATVTDSFAALPCTDGYLPYKAAGVWTCKQVASANTNDAIVTRDSSGNFVSGTGQFSTSVKITDGAAGGQVTIAAPSTFTSYNLTLPPDDGGVNQVLQTNGSGVLGWANLPSAPGDASYAAKGIVQFDTDLATSGITVASGVAKIGTGGVSAGMLATDSVTTAKIANLNVTTGKVADDAITFSKIQNITDARLIGRSAGSAGDAQEITVGSGLSLAGGTLTATGISVGDATYAAKGVVQLDTDAATSGIAITSGVIKLANSGVTANTYGSASSVPAVTVDAFGRVTGVTNTAIALNASAINAGTLPIARGGTNSGTALNNNRMMVSSGGAIVEAAALTDGQILIGSTGAAPVAASLTAGSGITITPSAGGISIAATASAPGDASYAAKGIVQFDTDLATSGITVASGVAKIGTGGVSTGMLASDSVTFAKTQNIATNKLLGRGTAGSGDIEELTLGTGLSLSGTTLNAATGLSAVTNTANLANTKIWIGDAGGKAQEFSLSGDATMTAGGVVTVDATSANTVSKIVKRDASGNFVAGTGTYNTSVKITDGAAGGQVTISAPSTFTSYNLTLPTDDGGVNQVLQTNGSGVLSWANQPSAPGDASYAAKGIVQFDTDLATSGITVASGVAKIGTGGVSNGMLANLSVGTGKVQDDAITFAKIQNITDARLIGRSAGSAGDAQEITVGSGLSLAGGTLTATGISVGDATYAAKGVVQLDTDAATSGIAITSGVIKLANSGVTANTYGSASSVPAITVDAFGRVTGVTNTAIALNASAINAGILPIARGGTNSGTALNNNRMMVSSGGAIVEAAALTNGQLLIGSTGAAPVAASLTAGSGITITPSAGGISIAATATAPGDASYAAKGIVQFDTDLATSGITVASGVAKIGTGGVSTGMLANDAVTFSKIQNITDNKLLGRSAGSAGDAQEITIGSGLSMSAGTLSASAPAVTNSSNLANTKIWIGDSGGKAQEFALSGEATMTAGGVVTVDAVSANTASKIVRRDASGNFIATSPTFTTSVNTPMIVGGTSTTQTLTYKTTSGVGAAGADHIFQVGNNGATEAMRILNNGNVGIGTPSPAVPLDVAIDQNASTLVRVKNASAGTAAGAGIYASNGTNTFTMSMSGTGHSSAANAASLLASSGSSMLNLTTAGAAPITFATNGSNERMRIDSAGNVGIGMSPTNGKFEVKGSIVMSGSTSGYSGFQVPAAAGSLIYTLPSAAPASNGHVLSSTTGGVMSWVAPGSGGDASYAAKGVVQFDTDAATSGISVTSGVAKLATSGVTAASYGSATQIPVFSVDSFGRVTSVTNTAISINASAITAGTLPVDRGGTGAASLGSGNLLVGAGTGAVTSLAAGVSGNVVYATGATTWTSGSPDAAGLVDKISTQVISGAKAFTNYLQMSAQNVLRFADSDSSNYVGFRAPATVSADVTWTLPAADGTSGQVLSTNGTGTLSWATSSGGGIQTPITTVQTLGAGCTDIGRLAKSSSDDLLVCDDVAVTMSGAGCSAVGVGAVTFDTNGEMYVCLN